MFAGLLFQQAQVVQGSVGIDFQAFQVVAKTLNGINPLLGTVMGQCETANTLIEIHVLGIDCDQASYRPLIAVELLQDFTEFFQLSGRHGRQGVEIQTEQPFVPAGVERRQEPGQVFQFRFFQAHMGEPQNLAGNVQSVVFCQLVEPTGNHQQQGLHRLNLAAEQRALTGVDPVGNLACQ